jgi:RimJ/RimL family protein N-acetyltransferase
MFRRAETDDAGLLACWLSDPENTRYLTSNLRGGTLSAALVQVALRRRDQAWYLFGPDGGVNPAGLLAVDSIEAVDGVANLWFVLGDKAQRRKGLTTHAVDTFCHDNPLGLRAVTAWAGAPNTASLACLRRAGFRELGQLPNSFAIAEGRFARILFERQLTAAGG